jgi:hydroxymethylglutaryl-CoA reductase
MTTSRISGFYNMTLEERRAKLTDARASDSDRLAAWTSGGLSAEAADHMIENVIGLYSLPLGIALNFMVNGRDVLVPMTSKSLPWWRAHPSWRNSPAAAADSPPRPASRS